MTYPDTRVAALLEGNFDFVKIDIANPGEKRDLVREIKPVWAPLFIARNRYGTELRRWNGWLAPDEFIAELTFVRAMHELLQKRIDSAYAYFRDACERTPDASVAAEALFWAGVAAFKRGGKDFAALRLVWDELRERYPASTWARRADVFDHANNGFT